jgi:hypothetical protein
MSSCLLSFLALRGSSRGALYETIADYLFLTGITLLFVTTLLFSFNVIV